MKLLIDATDLNKLSMDAKNEIADLLGFKFKKTQFSDESDDEIEDLTFKLLKKFMSGVAEPTKQKLKVFAEMEKTTIKDIEKATGEFKWAGFQSGVTRRLRTITGDPDAELFGWNEEEDWNKNSKVWVSKITRDSLMRYFKLD